MEKFFQNLEEADRILKTSGHMLYVTYPLVQDKKMLIKIIEEIKNAIVKSINAILQYDYLYKRIQLSSDTKINFENFKNKSAPRYEITEREIQGIEEILKIIESHKKSPMEFTRNDKVVILSPEMTQISINIEKAKRFLSLGNSIINKAKRGMIQKYEKI